MRSLKINMMAATALFAVCMTAFSGCSGIKAPSGLTAAASPSVSQTEKTKETTASEKQETSQTKASETAPKADVTFTMETFNAKKAAVNGTGYAIGTTYLGESTNEAALEVVLPEMGIDEELLKSDTTNLIDCGGTDIWFLCFNEDVTSVSVVMGDEEDGEEIYKSDNPGYIFIRCVSAGEVPACTVKVNGTKTGYTAYYPFMIAGQILLPNGGTVLNQSEGYESFIDEIDDTDNSEGTEEEEP